MKNKNKIIKKINIKWKWIEKETKWWKVNVTK